MSPKPALFRPLAFAALLFLLALPSPAAEQGMASEPWTLDDLQKGEIPRQIALTPDGKLALWQVQGLEKVGKEEKRISRLFARSLVDRQAKPVQLTQGDGDVLGFRVSPDGKTLGFLTRRPIPAAEESEGAQIWILPLTSPGEARAVSSFDRGVLAFEWIDNEHFLVLRAESKSALERDREKAGDTAEAISDPKSVPPVRLFKLGLDGKASRLSRNADWASEMAVAPDGKTAILTAQQDLDFEFNSKVPPKTFVLDLETGSLEEILAGTKLQPASLHYAPDSQSVYFADAYSSHPLYDTASIAELYHYDLASRKASKVDLAWPRGLAEVATPFWPLAKSSGAKTEDLLLLLADGVHFKAVRSDGKTTAQRPLEGQGPGQIERLALSADGKTVLYQASTLNLPTQIYAARLEGQKLVDVWQVSELNPSYAHKEKGRYEVIQYPGALGEEVEALVLYPFHYEEGQKYPLVLDIHGGPAGADHDSWDGSVNRIWQQRGAFVLQVNYHGSSSYGLAWVESIREKYYELEIPDIEAGVDTLIARGLVDPDRMASTGWSNGGILTAELITRTQRYKAAVVGAADVEWLSDWANVDFGASFDNYYFGGPPWERVQHYIDKSPFFRLGNVTTPTIIHTGTADRNVPPHQSWSLFRALQDLGKAPVRFLTYPGEPHGLQKVAHRRRRYAEDVAWLDKYLFGLESKTDPAIPQGSLLAGLLARKAAAHDAAGRFGVLQDGVLLPELVPFGALRVGRFEVTRAQYAAFDGSRKVAAGEENLPATGISFEQAKAFAAWAAAKMPGARLPTQEEAQKLTGKAGKSGNTLDRWLGYGANPEDADKARAAANAAGAGALLQKVGEGQAALSLEENPLAEGAEAQPGVFDLDGNAAEWVTLDGEKGEAFGPSADRTSDGAAKQEPAAAYTGLRLVAPVGVE